jgi:pimeloyl-ACP methyl ester carboxylesterase
MTTHRIVTTDGLHLALHDLATGETQRAGSTLFLSHATGFHAMVWKPMARHLGAYHPFAVDYRGHGDAERPGGDTVHWQGYVDDALATIDALDALGAGAPRFVIGHSMGGTTPLLVEVARPGTFAAMALYEPIVHPPQHHDTRAPTDLAIAAAARRRRAVFDSYDDAEANYSSKPPMNTFTAESVRAYVRHGFTRIADGKVRLKCDPEHEARTFEGNSTIDVWAQLDAVRCPVLVLGGRVDGPGPGLWSEPLGERLPAGTFHRFDQLGHLGPMQDPALVADTVAAFFAAHGGPPADCQG